MKRVQLVTIVLLLAATVLAACAPAGGRSAGTTLYVGSHQVPCTGVAPQMCMLVREDPKDDWTLFYDQIQGFEYEPGFQYELLVQKQEVENPPADASSIRWTLLEIVSKERDLEGTTWVLDLYVNSAGQPTGLQPDTQITVLFADGQLGGDAGCNSYTGQYTIDGAKIAIGVGAMTMMYCGPEEVMEQEQEYMAALGSSASYHIEGDGLRIANATGDTILQYRVQEAVPLVGTDWDVLMYNNGKGGYTSVLLDTAITALFGEDESLTGSAGCNNYTTSYKLDSSGNAARGAISIGPAVTTRMFCGEPEGTMEQEAAYLQALESAASYEIKGNELEIKNSEGTRVVTLVAKAEAAATGREYPEEHDLPVGMDRLGHGRTDRWRVSCAGRTRLGVRDRGPGGGPHHLRRVEWRTSRGGGTGRLWWRQRNLHGSGRCDGAERRAGECGYHVAGRPCPDQLGDH